jgi:hypothetical protein
VAAARIAQPTVPQNLHAINSLAGHQSFTSQKQALPMTASMRLIQPTHAADNYCHVTIVALAVWWCHRATCTAPCCQNTALPVNLTMWHSWWLLLPVMASKQVFDKHLWPSDHQNLAKCVSEPLGSCRLPIQQRCQGFTATSQQQQQQWQQQCQVVICLSSKGAVLPFSSAPVGRGADGVYAIA